jgi:hypothetical protein
MQTKQWIRRGIIAGVWGMAAATWASIGHHLFGMPDLVPLMALGAVAAVLAWPTKRPSIRIAASVRHQSSPRA